MLLLCIWSWGISHWQGGMIWFAAALVFAMLGDVLLMLPPGFFLAGLGAFLLGHIFFVVGFNLSGPLGSTFFWVLCSTGLLLVGVLLRFFVRTLAQKPHFHRIRFPVVVYTIVIYLMVTAAFSTFMRQSWGQTSAFLVAAGALLFAFSDGMLAYDRFFKKIRHAHVWIMITYHLAQFAILTGVLLHF